MTFRQFAFNNVARNKRTYAAYFLSSSFSVMVFFIYALFIYHPEISEGSMKQLVVNGMGAAQFIIYVFSFFFILYSVGAFLKSRKREFGVLMMHGMSQGQVNRLVFLENMIIGFAAIVTGILLGLLFAKVFLLIGGKIIDSPLPFYFSWKALLLTLVAFSGLFLIISSCTTLFVRGQNLRELLQGSAKPKKEPKASVLLSLLAAGLLGYGYYLSVTATEPTIAIRVLPVIGMVTVGTYFLFTQLSVFTIHALKRNRRFYWLKTNLITLSELAYRMKDNARIFFMVTIVTTVSICAVGSLAATGTMAKLFELSYPFAVTYISLAGNEKEAAHIAVIEKELKDRGLLYTKTVVKTKSQTSLESGNKVLLVSQSDYNRMAAVLGLQTKSLQSTEALFIPGMMSQIKMLADERKQVTFKESGIRVQVSGAVEKPIFNDYTMGTNILLVSDSVFARTGTAKNAAKTIYDQALYFAYEADNWQVTKGIGRSIIQEIEHADHTSMSRLDSSLPFRFSASGTDYAFMMQTYNVTFFIGMLVSSVFYIAAGSFLYFRLYTDLESDKRHYRAITKLGLSEKELDKIATTQLVLLFFIPIVVAVIHSTFAFMALQSLFNLSIAVETITVLIAFFLAQTAYFFLIRSRYLRHVREAVR